MLKWEKPTAVYKWCAYGCEIPFFLHASNSFCKIYVRLCMQWYHIRNTKLIWFTNNIQSMLAFKTYLTKAMDRLFIFHMQKQNMCVLHKFATHNNVLQLLKKQKKVIWLHQKFLNVRNSSTSVRAMHSVKANSTSTSQQTKLAWFIKLS